MCAISLWTTIGFVFLPIYYLILTTNKYGSNYRKSAITNWGAEIYELYGYILKISIISLNLTEFLSHLVPRSCIHDLWEAFNDIAEGFGLTVEEFQEIIKSALLEFLRVTERQLNSDSDAVFRLLDDDSVRLNIMFISLNNHQTLLYTLSFRIIWWIHLSSYQHLP